MLQQRQRKRSRCEGSGAAAVTTTSDKNDKGSTVRRIMLHTDEERETNATGIINTIPYLNESYLC